MLRHYLFIALLGLRRHKLYSAINILGLAVGLACCLLISLFVRYELSWDSSFTDAERIYRISPDYAANAFGPQWQPAANVAPLAPLLAASDVDGLQAVARIGGIDDVLVANGEQGFYEDTIAFADSALFSIFRFEWLQGEASTALSQPSGAVITASLARKYFGSENPLGQTLMLENAWPVTVSGVIADLPANSHLRAELLITIDSAWKLLDFDYSLNWSFTFFHTYLLLAPGAQLDTVMAQITDVVNAALASGVGERFGVTQNTFALTPYALADIHLRSGRPGEFKTPGSPAFVLTFSLIAAALLGMACINFMNLSTARASQRAKETGLRKAIGATRRELRLQFLSESFLFTGIALCIALALVEILLPAFSSAMDRSLDSGTMASPGFMGFIAGLTVLTALVAGSYPAFRLSAFRPVQALCLRNGRAAGTFTLRNVLVVVQFTLAITLLVATVVVYLQMQYARNFDLGFNKDQVAVLRGTNTEGLGRQWNVLKEVLLEHPDITHVTEADMSPGRAGIRRMRIEGGTPAGIDMAGKQVGFSFLEAYDIALVAGRYFDAAIASDEFIPPSNVSEGMVATGSYIINESAVRAFGLQPGEALGRTLEMAFSTDFSLSVPGPIIGVVEDVHLESLHRPIEPLVYFVPGPVWGTFPSFDIASVRITGARTQATLAWLREQWNAFIPELPFSFHFLDTDFDALYQAEEQQGRLFTFFAVLTVLIACLGLFGLASFTVQRRTREIGVRKVMGGSVWSIVLLLTNDFSRLVLLSNLIAWPIAWVAMNRWLENFAWRIDLTPLIFIGSGLIALCIAWVTVGSTAVRAAAAKPVLALRYE